MLRSTYKSVFHRTGCAKTSLRWIAPLGLALAAAGFALPALKPQAADPAKDADAAVERTRKQVRMLDGIYKNAIVLVTTHYVTEKSDLPAGSAFKKLFEVAKKEGWHEVRLLDATGEPYEPANAPTTEFEKKAIKELVSGKAYVDEVVTKDGKRYLHAATAIPVVMKKCVMCHENYANVPKAKPSALWATRYRSSNSLHIFCPLIFRQML